MEQLAKAMTFAFQLYRQQLELNIRLDENDLENKADNEIYQIFSNQIQQGRQLLGEPSDFNF